MKENKNSKQNNKKTQNEKPQEQQKVMTKYDRKMEAYEKHQEQERKNVRNLKIAGVLVLLVILGFFASFPIRSFMAANNTYISINGEKVTRVEFDYYYSLAKSAYLNQYGSYFSMFGMTDLSNIESEQYTEDMTFRDYFEKLTVENLVQTRALYKEARNQGFEYDVQKDYDEIMDSCALEAKENGVSMDAYLRNVYGSYASKNRLEQIQKDSLYATAYYQEIEKSKAPGEEAVEEYYQENKDEYDAVDYYLAIVDAEELAAQAETEETTAETETEETTAEDETEETTAETETEEELSEEEVAKIMEAAKEKANSLLSEVETEGTLYEGKTYYATESLLQEYLFDSERKEGDTTVIEDYDGRRYLVVKFVERRLVMDPTVDFYAISVDSQEKNVDEILAAYQSGEGGEESFKKLALENESSDEVYEGIDVSIFSEEMSGWLSAKERTKGDTASFVEEDGYGYVIYYVGTNKPVYYLNIENTLVQEAMNAYLEELKAGYIVEDPGKKLKYLQLEEAALQEGDSEENVNEASESADGEVDTESTAAVE